MRGKSTWFGVVMQRWAESRHIPLVPSEAQKAKSNYSVNTRVRDCMQMVIWQTPQEEGQEYSWKVRLMLVALGRYKWVQIGTDFDSGPCFAYLIVVANALNAIKESEQKILQQFGWLTIISSDRRTHFIAHNVQQGANKYPQY